MSDIVLVLDSHKDRQVYPVSDVVLVLDSHKDRQVYPVQDAVLVLGSHKDAETGSLPCARCSPGVGQSQRHRDRKLTLCKM